MEEGELQLAALVRMLRPALPALGIRVPDARDTNMNSNSCGPNRAGWFNKRHRRFHPHTGHIDSQASGHPSPLLVRFRVSYANRDEHFGYVYTGPGMCPSRRPSGAVEISRYRNL